MSQPKESPAFGRGEHVTAGHNSVDATAAERLKSIVPRIERLEEERAVLAVDIKDLYAAAKSGGLDPVVLRQLIRERKKDPAAREEQETILELYRRALGSLADTPLGESAVARETTRRAAAHA